MYYWVKVFDRKIKLIINENGIWYKDFGFLTWDNVWYYYFRESQANKAGKFHNLIFEIRNDEKDYNPDITFLDQNHDHISHAFKENAEKHGVYYPGFETST